MTAMLLGILFIAGIVGAGASLVSSVGRYGETAMALPEQVRSCRTTDNMRFRVRALINDTPAGSRVSVSDRAVFRRSPAWLAAA